MKIVKKRIKSLAAGLAVMIMGYQAQGQLVPNGDFSQPGPACSAGAIWQTSTGTMSPQYTNYLSGTNFWVDLTPCGSFGNNSWMEQTVSTVAGKLYQIEFDLGAINRWANFDAGVDVLINGSTLNAGTNRLSVPVPTVQGAMHWETRRSCIFQATAPGTTIRFVGNGQNGIQASPYYTAGPGIIGVDNVKLKQVILPYSIQSELTDGCNQVCFNLANDSPESSAFTLLNALWHVNGDARTAGNRFCYQVPAGITKTISVVYSVSYTCNNNTSVFTQTLSKVVTGVASCPCEFPSHVQLSTTRVSCNTFNFGLNTDVNFYVNSSQWVLDNQLINGQLTGLTLSNLSPGTHVICVIAVGGMREEGGNLCCANLCTTITVPAQTTQTRVIQYCPIANPGGPWYNPCNDCSGYYEFYKNGNLVGTSANGCISYVIDAPSEMRCFDVINGTHCLNKTIHLSAQAMPVMGVQAPDEVLEICGNTSTALYSFNCGSQYPNFEVKGPNGYFTQGTNMLMPSLILAPGDYTVDCINYEDCSILRRNLHVIHNEMETKTCGVLIESCAQLDPNNSLSFLQLMTCNDCKNTVQNAQIIGPWIHAGFVAVSNWGPYRLLTREYTDTLNCKKCIVTFTIVNPSQAYPGTNVMSTYTFNTNGQPCYTFMSQDFPICMQNKNVRMFEVGSNSGEILVDINQNLSLCCGTTGSSTYYLYAEEDPCCYLIITIVCNQSSFRSSNNASNIPISLKALDDSFRIVPNPASSIFRIESTKTGEVYDRVEIMELTGKILMVKNGVNQNTKFDMTAYNRGSYLVVIYENNQKTTLKLLLAKD